MLTWAAELRLNFISTQVARHKRVWKISKRSAPAGYDSGVVSQYLGTGIDTIKLFILFHIRLKLSQKVRWGMLWISGKMNTRRDNKVVKLRTLLDEIYFYYHKSISCSDNNSTPQEWYQFNCTCAMCKRMVKLPVKRKGDTWSVNERMVLFGPWTTNCCALYLRFEKNYAYCIWE